MLFGKIIAADYENYTQRINKLSVRVQTFLLLQQAVHIITAGVAVGVVSYMNWTTRIHLHWTY